MLLALEALWDKLKKDNRAKGADNRANGNVHDNEAITKTKSATIDIKKAQESRNNSIYIDKKSHVTTSAKKIAPIEANQPEASYEGKPGHCAAGAR